MSSHSEEIWESFDALWRRMQQLSCQVKELEARLGVIEEQTLSEFEPKKTGRAISLYEGEIRR
ncbi:MAG: hypothetical protein WBV94_12775 [Blastocatellia bacterium]